MRKMVKRSLYMMIGVLMVGLSVSVMQLAAFGTDPFSCMNIGVGNNVLKIGYGNWQLILSIFLLIPMLISMRKSIGAGTVANMIFVGYSAEFFTFLLGQAGFTAEFVHHSMVIRILLVMVALLAVSIGIGLYMECKMGIAPYDALAEEIELWTKGKIPFRFARILTDVLCVVIGIASHNIVGVGTLIMALGAGPIISFFRTLFSKTLLKDVAQTIDIITKMEGKNEKK